MTDKLSSAANTSCIHHLFEAQVYRTPDACAVVFEDTQLTYHELNCKANKLASYLRTLDVQPEVLVGICMERSTEMLVALLGVLKAGGAYVPLDPDFPENRLIFMAEDAQISVLITEGKLQGKIPSKGIKTVCLDLDCDMIEQQQAFEKTSIHQPDTDNLAYVIYTSGSTGTPKGVQISHGAVVNFLKSMAEKPGISPNDILMAVTTLSFDIAVLELFLPLISGARVVIVPREIAYDGARLLEKIKSSKATILQATPATWRLLINAMWQGEPELKILCGGEALPRDLANELIDRSANVWNMYGPTETTVWSTCWKIEKKEGPILIGRPIANTQVYILDQQMQPVPVGVAGDLYIGGEGLARGYLNRPDLTNKVFLQNSFHINSPNARIYKTGDSARYHNDGNIEYINRSDNQVKIRGFRIELGEIETVLLQHKAVQNAVVIVWEGRPGDKRLIAYIVPKQDMDIVEKQLRDELRQKLPEYMLPQHFIKIDALPLTPNGKIDRRALHVLKVDISSCNEEYIPPDSSTEKMLAEIWKDIISLPRVGRTDNFFEIGGHSVLAVQMISMVLKVFNVELPLRTVFETKTLTDLSQYVDALLYAATSASAALNENSAGREEIEF